MNYCNLYKNRGFVSIRNLSLSILIVFIFIAKLSATIVRVDNFEQIQSYTSGAVKETLVVLDIDNTLIMPSCPIFRPKHRALKRLMDEYLAKKVSDGRKIELFRSRIFKATRRYTDKYIPEYIKFLRENNIPAIALTSADTGKKGLFRFVEDEKIRHLTDIGIDFSLLTPFCGSHVMDHITTSWGVAMYKEGVAFSCGGLKGPVLKELLFHFGASYSHIVCVDDSLDVLEDVREVCTTGGIQFTGLHFTKVDDEDALDVNSSLDLAVVQKQYDYFIETGEWIAYEHVGINTSIPIVKFAVIGDYGEIHNDQTDHPAKVAARIKKNNPDFIVTVGDNCYVPRGGSYLGVVDYAVGRLYSQYMFLYNGNYSKGDGKENRFFPCIGDHDIEDQGLIFDISGYTSYFSFLSEQNARHYSFQKGCVQFFMLNSDLRDPDPLTENSKQIEWLKGEVSKSGAPWKIVVFHHPVYSSGYYAPGYLEPNVPVDKWASHCQFRDFKELGISLILHGHIHAYERLNINDVMYVTNGLSGATSVPYFFSDQIRSGSICRHQHTRGFVLIESNSFLMRGQFIDVHGTIIDDWLIIK